MDLEREKLYAYDAGVEAGEKKKAIENAKKLLEMNLGTVEQISSAIGLSIEEVTALKKEIAQ